MRQHEFITPFEGVAQRNNDVPRQWQQKLSESFWLPITVGKTPSPEAFEFAMG
jgi:hypothetical protein